MIPTFCISKPSLSRRLWEGGLLIWSYLLGIFYRCSSPVSRLLGHALNTTTFCLSHSTTGAKLSSRETASDLRRFYKWGWEGNVLPRGNEHPLTREGGNRLQNSSSPVWEAKRVPSCSLLAAGSCCAPEEESSLPSLPRGGRSGTQPWDTTQLPPSPLRPCAQS